MESSFVKVAHDLHAVQSSGQRFYSLPTGPQQHLTYLTVPLLLSFRDAT